MCTVTVLPRAGGLRVLCNRDESRTRSTARPPEVREIDGRGVLMPVDPDSDGTWIAVNDAGLVLALLNRNPPPKHPIHDHPGDAFPVSRGGVIPALAQSESVTDVESRIESLDASGMRPFRLLAVDHERYAEWMHEGDGPRPVRSGPLETPIMLTSSGLGDHLVEPPRMELFESVFGDLDHSSDEAEAVQDRFHRHRWADHEHVSVWMAREDAWTTSLCEVRVEDGSVRMRYVDRTEGEDAELREFAGPLPVPA